MLNEKFDTLELLRLAIADREGNSRCRMTRSVVLGELAFLQPAASLWAGLLLQRVEVERVVVITPPIAVRERWIKSANPNIPKSDDKEWSQCISYTHGKVEFTDGQVKSGDFYRVRNILARLIEKAMIANRFRPTTLSGRVDKIAKGLAEVVLRGHIFGKGMCSKCAGVGKLEVYKDGKQDGIENCERCGATGKLPYTINEKIKIAGLIVAKSGYQERYLPYERVAESYVAEWNNQIRDQLARSFYFKDSPIAS